MKTVLEQATESLARLKNPNLHSQRCPCWTAKAPVAKCDCWILTGAREQAEVLQRAGLLRKDEE